MPFVSYAQNFEDVMLWRALKNVENGFYIDVGACDPEIDSVTRAFYEHGWSGINIEPVSQWYKRLLEQRTEDINLQVAAGQKQEEIDFYEIPGTGLSTWDKATAQRHEMQRGVTPIIRSVPVYTITKVYDQYCEEKPIHFMKIDVEGAEEAVLKGIDFSRIRPWILLIESTIPNEPLEDFAKCSQLLDEIGYQFVYFDGLNRFYISPDHPELADSFRAPPNVFDDFSLAGTGTSSFVYLQKERIAELNRDIAAINQNLGAQTACKNAYESLLVGLMQDMGMSGSGRLVGSAPSTFEQGISPAQLEQIKSRVISVNAELERFKLSYEQAVADGRYWERRAESLTVSLSWRITRPMRALASGIQRGGAVVGNGLTAVTHYPLRVALSNPVFAAKFTAYLLKRFPRVHGFLRNRAISIGSMQESSVSLYGRRALDIDHSHPPAGALMTREQYQSEIVPTEVLIDRIYSRLLESDRAS